jgi:hypothetical protein
MRKYYVYLHRRKDTGEIFYIGMGSAENERCLDTRKRNYWWTNIVNKHGFYAEIIYDNLTFEAAEIIEIMLISKYGRMDMGTGILVNMTDGGGGSRNKVVSEHTKKLLKDINIGKKATKETRRKISKALKGKKKPNLSKYMTGLKNPEHSERMKGHKHPNSKLKDDEVLDMRNGYDNLKRGEKKKYMVKMMDKYNMSYGGIQKIIYGISYSHI